MLAGSHPSGVLNSLINNDIASRGGQRPRLLVVHIDNDVIFPVERLHKQQPLVAEVLLHVTDLALEVNCVEFVVAQLSVADVE